ncbi:hypothetical protein QYE76_036580 [Lolium multiflorum]|uniref:Uncharacterized protein n=1 Tax=Lolium multiflorum TaxID=4521 RepID=A0AAD8R284_LOLMU|nr:hypothetical protein QYE76_036580 [Lolium multiflorum]
MAAMAMDIAKPSAVPENVEDPAKGRAAGGGEGLRQYYLQHIHDLQLQIRQNTHNLNRLEAQRNNLNSRGNELNVKCLRRRKEEARCSSHGGAAGRLVDAMCVDSTAHATPSIPPVCVVRVDRERGAYGTVGSRAGAGDQQVELLVPETPPSGPCRCWL